MLLTALALSATLQFDCPPGIETRQQLLTTPDGWQGLSRDPEGKPSQNLSHRLANLALFDGEPGELVQLKPDNGDSDDIHYWSQLGSSLRPLYLVCHYQWYRPHPAAAAAPRHQLLPGQSGRPLRSARTGLPQITP